MKTISVDVDVDVSLDDFDDDELLDECEARGLDVSNDYDRERIEHLMDCGLIEQAKEEAWAMILKSLSTD